MQNENRLPSNKSKHANHSNMKATPSGKETLRRASIACVACRDRRIKCDGEGGKRGDQCTHCNTSNRTCTYRFDDRRKRSSKAYIQTLQDRIAELEESRSSNLSMNYEQTEDYASFHVPLSTSTVQPQNKTPDNSRSVVMPPPNHQSTSLDYQNLSPDDTTSRRMILNTNSMTKDFGLSKNATSTAHPRTTAKNTGSVSVADRLGYMKSNLSEDENGQLHFFGYSSNLQIVSFLPTSPLLIDPQSPSQVTESEVGKLADSTDLRDHLIGLYFTYQHPALPMLDENTFKQGYSSGIKSQYFSQFLLYSVLLRSLRLSNKPGLHDVGAMFLRRAKAELLAEMESPTISTIQALCLFGHYLGSLGNDRSCWLFPGMAFRLLFDLGLHQDCTELLNAGLITENDRKVRHVTLWGCYIIDKLYSCFQGRPTAVKLIDISTPFPCESTVGSQHQILSAWVDLARILDDIINVVNRQDEKLLDDPVTLSKLSITGNKLLKWLKRLPTELQWDSGKVELPPPSICAIHMQFLATTILLHRPFSASVVKPMAGKSVTRQLQGYTPIISQQICTLNSMRIAKILSGYHRQFGLEKIFSWIVPVILTASLSLISDIASETHNGEKVNERNWLKLCFTLQKELSSSVPLAGRNLAILKSMLDHCGYPELSHLADEDESRAYSSTQVHYIKPKSGAGVLKEKPLVADFGRDANFAALDQMEVDPAMGPQDFDFSDFFPQFMPLGFGDWTSEPNSGLELNMDSNSLKSFGQDIDDAYNGMSELPLNYPYQ